MNYLLLGHQIFTTSVLKFMDYFISTSDRVNTVIIAQDQLIWTTKIKQDDLYGGESKGRPLEVC